MTPDDRPRPIHYGAITVAPARYCRYCGKRAFRRLKSAQNYRAAVFARHDGRKPINTLTVYLCDQGLDWHVGHSQVLNRALNGAGTWPDWRQK